MKKDEMIIEDYERLSEMDKMYLAEKEQEMIHEWQQWEEEQGVKEKLPAKIVVKIKKEENEKVHINKIYELSSSRSDSR